jgi:hypothetical protein
VDERPVTFEHHRSSRSRRSIGPLRVAGFPGWTHLVATLAFPAWYVWSVAHRYGIDTRYGWWTDVGPFMAFLAPVVLTLVMPPAVALEAWAVSRATSRWPARIAVICYVLIAGFVSFIPAGFRFVGDTSATPVDEITTSLAVYWVVLGTQVVCAYLACRMWTRRRT